MGMEFYRYNSVLKATGNKGTDLVMLLVAAFCLLYSKVEKGQKVEIHSS